MRRRSADMVVVTCYGQSEVLPRKKAMEKYLEGMRCSEGSEHERYESIYFQLLDGAKEATDEIDWR